MRAFRYAILLTTALSGFSVAAYADVIESGTNFPVPVVPGGDVFVGNAGQTGTLTINNGTQFTATGLFTGIQPTGNGTLTVDGQGTKVTINHTDPNSQVFTIGDSGIGSATISGGAVFDASAPGCPGGLCTGSVAAFAGSQGTLTITGAGSTFNAPNILEVATGAVSGPPNASSGTPGGASSGTVLVKSGGTLNTQDVVLGNIGGGNAQKGTETATGNLTVTGPGSTWNAVVTAAEDDLEVGRGPNSTGNLVINNGGALNLSGGGTAGPGLNIGGTAHQVGGKGAVMVDNGTINMSGFDPFLNVGRSAGNGTLTIKNGGTVNGVFLMSVGRNGSSGTLTVDGPGSSLNFSGTDPVNAVTMKIGTADSATSGLGATSVGTVSVTNGGKISLDTTNNGNGAVLLGVNGGTGTLNVSGAGSQVVLSGSGGTNNVNNSGNTFIGVGRTGTGTLNITNGGHVIVNDTSSSAFGNIGIGGSSNDAPNLQPASVGTVTVAGAGSRLDIQSIHGFIQTGDSTTGTLVVQSGGAATAEGMNVGRNTGSVGTLLIDGPTSTVTLSGDDGNGGPGARMQLGRAGNGQMTIQNGGQLNVNATAAGGGVYIGGISTVSGGNGTATLTGGSSININGTGNQLVVGANGTGALTIAGGSRVNVAAGTGSTGQTFVGNTGSVGTLMLTGASTLNAGSLLGIGSNGTSNTGTGTVLMTGNSTITATNIAVGSKGIFGGNGTVNGNVTNNGGILKVGASPDALHINGNYNQTGGVLKLEVDGNGHGGFLTDTLVFKSGATIDFSHVTIDIDFLNGADAKAFLQSGQFDLDTFLQTDNGTAGDGPLAGLDTIFQDPTFIAEEDDKTISDLSFSPDGRALSLNEVPEPGSAVLFLSALAALPFVARRRRPA